LEDCCFATARRYAAGVAGIFFDEPLTKHLTSLTCKWGPITKTSGEAVQFICTTSPAIGVNAETGRIPCTTCGKPSRYVILGSRLFYFIWRVMMATTTAWQAPAVIGGSQSRLTLRDDWPTDVELLQIAQAYRLYFDDAVFLDDRGLTELNETLAGVSLSTFRIHEYATDMAELFVLMHEIQHQAPYAAEGMGFETPAPENIGLSPQQAAAWGEELTHDANGVYALWLSVASVLMDKFSMPKEIAKLQAASLAFSGADAALFAMQRIQDREIGPVSLADAVFEPAFLSHPTAELRRSNLSHVGCRVVTGGSVDQPREPTQEAAWQFVAGSIVGQMQMLDRLFAAYEASPHAR
jgi:hypothetical protein